MIILNVFYQGTNVVPSKYTTPLLAIGPAVTAANETDYPGLAVIDGTTIDGNLCTQHDAVNMMFPISVDSYNIKAQRAAFDSFNAFTADPTFYNSAVLFEAYSTEAVKAVSDASTAVPNRGDNILMYVTFPVIDLVVGS